MNVGLIPARGNSKGIPGKNLKELDGRPLLQWTIDAACDSALDVVVVTTEDKSIKEWCKGLVIKSGFGVLDRPMELSQDHVQVDEVALFSLRQLQQMGLFDIKTLTVLQPTSPFRSSQHIDEALDLYLGINKHKYQGMVFSCRMDSSYHYTSLESGFCLPIEHKPQQRLGRQDREPDELLLTENGAIYVVSAEEFSRTRTMRSDPMIPYCMDDISSLELDTRMDWLLAEAIIKEGL